MRRSFRQFLAEVGFTSTSFGADVRNSQWNLPSLNLGAMSHQYQPPGGYQSFGQMAQHHQNLARFRDPDYIEQQTLERLASLAENATVAVENKNKGQLDPNGHFEHAQVDKHAEMITGLSQQDVISGLFPRLKLEEMQRGEALGILVHDPSTLLYVLNVGVLRKHMLELRDKMSDKEFHYSHQSHLVGQVDKAFDAMTQGGGVRLDPSTGGGR